VSAFSFIIINQVAICNCQLLLSCFLAIFYTPGLQKHPHKYYLICTHFAPATTVTSFTILCTALQSHKDLVRKSKLLHRHYLPIKAWNLSKKYTKIMLLSPQSTKMHPWQRLTTLCCLRIQSLFIVRNIQTDKYTVWANCTVLMLKQLSHKVSIPFHSPWLTCTNVMLANVHNMHNIV
jgi:hypothetical protein